MISDNKIKEFCKHVADCLNDIREGLMKLQKELSEEETKVEDNTNYDIFLYLYGEPEGIKSASNSLSSRKFKGHFKKEENDKILIIPELAITEFGSEKFNEILKLFEDREWIYGVKVIAIAKED